MPLPMKYIAAGYPKDAEKLMLDFISESSTDFSVFINKWKAHNFAAVYLGRQKCELQQFTQEIFQITLNYLRSTSFYRRIGTIYLLYALFRNQILDPPVKIRIVLHEFKVIQDIHDIAEKNGSKELYYVIEFLIKNAFDFVAKGFLYGPKSSKFQKDTEPEFLFNDFKREIAEVIDNDVIKEVTDLNDLYIPIKLKFQDPKWTECLDLRARMQALYEIVDVGTSQNAPDTHDTVEVEVLPKEQDDIGARRAKLKSSSFTKPALFRQLNASDQEGEEESERLHICPNVPKRKRKKRLPKEDRRKGRPCKIKKEDLSMESSDEEKSEVKSIYARKPGPISRIGYLEYYDDSAIRNMKYVSSEDSEELSVTDEDDCVLVF